MSVIGYTTKEKLEEIEKFIKERQENWKKFIDVLEENSKKEKEQKSGL